jgi:hypothetical protein
VLSDLADGHPEGPALGADGPVPVWVALPELRGAAADCALMRADRSGSRVRVGVACGPGVTPAGRDIVVEDADGKELGRVGAPNGTTGEAVVLLPSEDAAASRAHLLGGDAVVGDDFAPVLPEMSRGAIGVVADSADETVATGGAPIVEQALSALKLDVDVRPIPAFPDRAEELAGDLGVLLDDPPGLTPEQRHALGGFLDGGGVVLVALGPHAAAAPLGASLEPVLAHSVSWGETKSAGGDAASAVGPLAEPARSLVDLGTTRRTILAPEDASAMDPLVKWTDGAPLVARRSIGRGEAWIVTLPFSVDESDLALRPAFLALLDAWVRVALERAAPKRSDVGTTWRFPGAHTVGASGPAAVAVSHYEGVARIVPPLVGVYHISVDGKTETRVAAPVARELDFRPRPASPATSGEGLGERRAAVDVSGQVALALLALVAAEIALRAWSRRKVEPV